MFFFNFQFGRKTLKVYRKYTCSKPITVDAWFLILEKEVVEMTK